MSEKPILFSAPMVRSILAGQKRHTRRIVKNIGTAAPVVDPWDHWQERTFGSCATDGTTAIIRRLCT